jgi:hypothetical protein
MALLKAADTGVTDPELFGTPRCRTFRITALGVPLMFRHTCLFFFLTAGLLWSARSQGMFEPAKDARPQRFAAGFDIGLLTYSGDVDKGGQFNGDHKWLLSASVTGQIKLFKIGNILYAHVMASAGYDPLKATSNEYDFKTDVFHVNGQLKVEFFTRSPFRPYVSSGLGMVFFDPQSTIKSARIEQMYPSYRGVDKSAVMVPISVGVLWTLGKSMDFYYTFTKTLCFNDNLDGWVAEYNDNFQSITFGVLFYF